MCEITGEGVVGIPTKKGKDLGDKDRHISRRVN